MPARGVLLLIAACLMLLGSVTTAQQQLRTGDTIQVVSGPLNVRNSPGTGGSVIGQLVQDQAARITDGSPYWADGYWWWSVGAADGTAGWIAEGDASEAYIRLSAAAAAPEQVVQAEPAGPAAVESAQPRALETTAVPEATPPAVAATQEAPLPAEPAPEPESEPDPYAHLPEPVRLEREFIDAHLGGLRVSLAIYGSGPSRGGPAFSWATDVAPETYYWCETGLLTAGPPYFERIKEPPAAELQFAAGQLSAADITVSCTATGGLMISAAEFSRTLAVLGPAWPYPQERQLLGANLQLAEADSLLKGTVRWLEVAGLNEPVEVTGALVCSVGQAGLLAGELQSQNVLSCMRPAGPDLPELLLIDSEAAKVSWELRSSDGRP